jgi:hypothetical protein
MALLLSLAAGHSCTTQATGAAHGPPVGTGVIAAPDPRPRIAMIATIG